MDIRTSYIDPPIHSLGVYVTLNGIESVFVESVIEALSRVEVSAVD